jgi:hypothetical protein
MNFKRQTRFIDSVAVILFILAALQIFTSLKIQTTLNVNDGLLGVPIKECLYGIAGIELALSAYLLIDYNVKLKLSLIAWLMINLLVYQNGLQWNGSPNYLVCLGNLNADFPVPPLIFSCILFPIFGFCVLGSCGFLVQDWLAHRKPATIASEKEAQIQTV